MKFLAVIICMSLSFPAMASDKPFRIGGFLKLGLLKDINTSDSDEFNGTEIAFGPTAYLRLNPVWTLRSSISLNKVSVDSDFLLLSGLLGLGGYEVDSDYIGLKFGAQAHINRSIAFYFDYNMHLKAGGYECHSVFSPTDATEAAEEAAFCSAAEDDLESVVHILTAGMLFETGPWFSLEPYFQISLSDYGKDFFKDSWSTGLALVFAF